MANQKADTVSKGVAGAVSDPTKDDDKRSPEKKRHDELRDILLENKKVLQSALPKFIPADRMIRVALLALNKPKMLKCTTASIMGSILQSCQLGLLPDGITGEAYLIPYEKNVKDKAGNWHKEMQCQLMPGYRGLITLGYRSGMVKSFQARAVAKGDQFEYEFGLNERCVHVPNDANVNPAELTHVYAVIKMTTGGDVFDVMTKQKVEAIRAFSPYPNSDAWVQHYDEMAIKTVIRRIAKRCPLSPEFNAAIALDESFEVLGVGQNNGLLLNQTESPQLQQLGESTFEQIKFTFDDEPVYRTDKVNMESPAKQKADGAINQTMNMIKDYSERWSKPGAHNPE